MTIKDTFLAEFDHEMASTRRLLERVPEERFDWKPHEKSMSLGGLATHLSNLPHWAEAILTGTSFDLETAPPNLTPFPSRAAVLAHFDETTKTARALMDKTDAEWAARWTLKRGSYEVFSIPRMSAFRTFILNHMIHHRGQLSVYLRLNDVPVPSIYGPSADEQ
jgi:uncharacterized damage-inducible protein DinB